MCRLLPQGFSLIELGEIVALLERTPAALDSLLRGLPEAWVRCNEGPDTWSPFDIVGHLIVIDRTQGVQRVRKILESGESAVFDPVDRFVQLKENQDKTLDQLLDEFALVRGENLAALRALELKPEDLPRTGKHPAFGAVTLSEVLATWAVHDLNHLHQLSRTMAHLYGDSVGPWRKFMGVLYCEGHGA